MSANSKGGINLKTKTKQKILLITWIFINIIIYWTSISMAYLDPSAMTYMIQVGAAIIIAISTSIGILFYKLKRKFFKKKKKEDTIIDETTENNHNDNI